MLQGNKRTAEKFDEFYNMMHRENFNKGKTSSASGEF